MKLKQFLLEFEPPFKPEYYTLADIAMASRDKEQPGSIGWLKHDRDYHHNMSLGHRERGLNSGKHDSAKTRSTIKWAAKSGFAGLKAFLNHTGG